jgi:two-component system, sensor histidine kinase ChiS
VQKHPKIFCLVVVLTTCLFVWNAAQGNIALDEANDSLPSAIQFPSWKMWWVYVVVALLLTSLFLTWRLFELKRQKLKRELELEHLEAEKFKELDSIKSRFFTNISHEFRTPLTLILGQIERLQATISEGEAASDLEIMQRSAQRLHGLINQLLGLSKLESGQMRLHVRKENIVSLTSRYLQSFESLATKRNIKLAFFAEKENIPLFADRDKFEIILFNLLSNAFKFTKDGGRIEVKAAGPAITPEDGTEMVSITVSDNGCGIPREDIPLIFERFYQADDGHNDGLEGTGIGLALVKELVGLHHGRITLDSRVSKGTSFVVYLPADRNQFRPDELVVEADEISVDQDADKVFGMPVVDLGRGRALAINDRHLLLVVEDNDDLRNYIRKCLTEDYCVLESRHGEEGFGMALANIPDLVITDVMMPQMDGHEFCRRLKADERTSHIPVILLTARAASEDKLEGLQFGADDFITKPFNMQELKVRIRNLIGQRERLRERYKSRYLYAGVVNTDPSFRHVSSDEAFLLKARDFITRNLSDPELSVEQFSAHMAMSHSQFYRKLKALVDSTPSEMVRTFRLQRAAELLAHRTGNVSEIAYIVGFNNPSYFAECFRKHFGCLPSEYKSTTI